MIQKNPQHIVKTPGVCGGRACIAGHRIRVMDIVVMHEKRGYSPDEIVDQYPGITLADVYAALAYYFDNREEIEAEFRRDEELEKQGMNEAGTGSKLRRLMQSNSELPPAKETPDG